MHFDSRSELLTAEDPKFLYFCRNLIWSKFARQVGCYSIAFKAKYDFALSFAGEDRNLAEALAAELASRELNVFYDKDEQHRILANDVEAYLAPIYRSEARFVVSLLSGSYPKKIWTKFESEQFKERFGKNDVIPVWYKNAPAAMFDESRRYGGISFDPLGDLGSQVRIIADVLSKRLEEERSDESVDDAADSSFGVRGTSAPKRAGGWRGTGARRRRRPLEGRVPGSLQARCGP